MPVLLFGIIILSWALPKLVYTTTLSPSPDPTRLSIQTTNSRGRKASESSKAPRKGNAARGKSTRSDADSDSFSKESDGIFTLFIGAGIALLVAAVSSGGGRGHGRRRDVVRQRTATRAAKTVGSYVEPPQRTAVAALVLHAWGNLKRYYMILSVLCSKCEMSGKSWTSLLCVGVDFYLRVYPSLHTEPRGRGGLDSAGP